LLATAQGIDLNAWERAEEVGRENVAIDAA
jgi:hypothetical protein